MSLQEVTQGQLQAMPLENLIGSPLVAAVKAQNLAARTTVDFVNAVGFNENADGTKEPVNVTFTYQEGDQNRHIIVPLITILPIPYLRLDDVNINFKASIVATGDEGQSTSAQLDAKQEAELKVGYGPYSANVQAVVAADRASDQSKNSRFSIEYTMDVNVHAVQDDMSAGMQRVLSILQNSITTVPAPPAGPTGTN